MKLKQTHKIELKKLTIARINTNAMQKIKGGDCLPTEPHPPIPIGQPSEIQCPTTVQLY